MRSFEQSSFFYNQIIKFVDLEDYEGAINTIREKIVILKNIDDIALAYLNSGFLNDKLGDNISAIDDFTKSIYFEDQLESLNQRSKDISFSARSNSMYKNGNYREAIEDKIKAKKIRSLEYYKPSEFTNTKIDYKSILLGTFLKKDLGLKFNTLIKVSKIEKSKYDLIKDYKKLISNKRKDEAIRKLELLSELKYKDRDYKGSIRAIRRAEKYY